MTIYNPDQWPENEAEIESLYILELLEECEDDGDDTEVIKAVNKLLPHWSKVFDSVDDLNRFIIRYNADVPVKYRLKTEVVK